MRLGIKKYSSYLAVLGLAFLAGMLAPELRADYAQTSVGTYGDDEVFEDDLIELHTTMNDITNEFLDNLFTEQELVLEYPLDGEGCTEDNVSTYCLAVKLNDELYAFEESIVKAERKKELEPGTTNLEDAVTQSAARKNFIETELFAARETLELTLSVYNEVQNVFPTHKALLTTIVNLEDYRNNLAKIRDVIELYPGKFNDASTIQCK